MPRKSCVIKPGLRKYGTKSNYTPEQLEEALEKIKSGAMSRVDASKLYKIPPVTLYYKLNAKHNKNVGRPVTLSAEEEESLQNHLLLLSDMGFPLSMLDFRVIVRDYLNKNNKIVPKFRENMPGYEWGTLFLERHPLLKEKIAHKIPRKRAQVNREQVEIFFNNFAKESEGVAPKNLYNMDESGFHDDPGKKKLLFRRDCKHPDIIKNSSKSCFTVVFCGNAAGELVPPFFIFKGVKLWSDWLYQAPEGSRMAVSKSGWMETAIFEDWLENQFIPFVKKDEGKKVLLCDNLSAHISPKALRLCADNNISFICLIPNSTHLLQPLDVGYFSAVKSAWRKVLDDYRQTCRGKKVLALPKSLFAQLIKKTLQNGNDTASDNLKAGFRSCGLHPLSPETVLNKLPAYTAAVDIRETISESFVTFIENVRQSDLNNVTKGKKFQLPVVAGKSVSAEEVEKYYKEREKTENNKNGNVAENGQKSKKRGRPIGSKNKKKKRLTDPVLTVTESVNNEVVDTIDFQEGRGSDESEPELQNVRSHTELVVEAMIHRPASPEVALENQNTIQEAEVFDTYTSMSNIDEHSISIAVQEDDVETAIITIPGDLTVRESEEQILWEDNDLPIVEEYVVESVVGDSTANKSTKEDNTRQNEPKKDLVRHAICVFRTEGSLFPGQIREINFPAATVIVSVFQKSFVGGWVWPKKAEILQINISDIVNIIKEHKITKKSGVTYINDDNLCMEWGE